jgi:hypothetical protein
MKGGSSSSSCSVPTTTASNRPGAAAGRASLHGFVKGPRPFRIRRITCHPGPVSAFTGMGCPANAIGIGLCNDIRRTAVLISASENWQFCCAELGPARRQMLLRVGATSFYELPSHSLPPSPLSASLPPSASFYSSFPAPLFPCLTSGMVRLTRSGTGSHRNS